MDKDIDYIIGKIESKIEALEKSLDSKLSSKDEVLQHQLKNIQDMFSNATEKWDNMLRNHISQNDDTDKTYQEKFHKQEGKIETLERRIKALEDKPFENYNKFRDRIITSIIGFVFGGGLIALIIKLMTG